MSVFLDTFESQLAKSPELIDRFFKNGKFEVDALLAGAKDLGYEFEDHDLAQINGEISQKPMAGNVSYLVPNKKTGEITEMTLDEVELVAGGLPAPSMLPSYSYTNININLTAAVAVVAIAIILIIMIGETGGGGDIGD